MQNYHKLTFKELRTRMNSSPADTPDYIKAKDELKRRVAIIGVIIAATGLALAFIWHYLSK